MCMHMNDTPTFITKELRLVNYLQLFYMIANAVKCMASSCFLFPIPFLNKVHVSCRLVHTWLFKIVLSRVLVYVHVVHPRGY